MHVKIKFESFLNHFKLKIRINEFKVANSIANFYENIDNSMLNFSSIKMIRHFSNSDFEKPIIYIFMLIEHVFRSLVRHFKFGNCQIQRNFLIQ